MDSILFPFAEYWWFYGGFLIFVLIMLALDLGVFNRKAHTFHLKKRPFGASFGSRSRSALTFFFINTRLPNSARKLDKLLRSNS
ncbi:MAG: hypothetical protein ACR2IA_07210 [Pyrinomonadaceae bacterium]